MDSQASPQSAASSNSGRAKKGNRKGMCLGDRPLLEPNAAGIDIGRAYSKIPIGRFSSSSTSTSMSLSARASLRATEPNTAACATPSRRKSVSWARSVSNAFWRTSLIAHHESTRRFAGSGVDRPLANAPSARIHEGHPGGRSHAGLCGSILERRFTGGIDPSLGKWSGGNLLRTRPFCGGPQRRLFERQQPLSRLRRQIRRALPKQCEFVSTISTRTSGFGAELKDPRVGDGLV